MRRNVKMSSAMTRLLLGAALILAATEVSSAQSSANTTVPLNATVVQGLSLAVAGTLSFGSIVAGTTPASINAQTNSNAPLITVTGNGSSVITVTFGASTLTGPGSAITFNPSVYGASSSSNQSTSTSVTTGGTVTLSGTTGSAGNYYFWLGGSLSALPPIQAPGTYNGTWTISVSY